MTLTLWLGTYLLHSTVLLIVARVLTHRTRDAASAETVWKMAALLPMLSATAASLQVGPRWTIDSAVGGSDGTWSSAVSPRASGVVVWNALAWWATMAWLAGGSLLLARDVVGRIVFMRRLGLREVAGPRAQRLLMTVQGALDVRRRLSLTTSSSLASPIVCGRAEICLPRDADARLDDRTMSALLAHEVAHVIRQDAAWFMLLGGVESLLFVQPLNRTARREVQRLAEQACDGSAAAALGDPRAMAECLIEVATWARGRGPVGVAAMAACGSVSARIERLLRPGASAPPTRTWARCSAAGVLAVALFLPAISGAQQSSNRTAAADPQRMSSESDQQSADFRAGFEAARRYRQLGPDPVRARIERPYIDSAWRVPDEDRSSDIARLAEIERRLQASRAPRR